MTGPDPHFAYARHEETPGEPGPLLLVGRLGVFVVSLADGGDVEYPGTPAFRFPELSDVGSLRPLHRIATWRNRPVYAASVRELDPTDLDCLPRTTSGGEPLEETGYRELYGAVGDEELSLACRAIQIVDWEETSRFCSRCGSAMEAQAAESVKRCPVCTLQHYPRLAPAMIVGVVRDRRLLLGQSPRFRGRFHSILAGFLEPGETAEECVHREVFEEVGIRVRNVRYFASQPWPFPHSLMLGFTAEYDAGELTPDPAEIIHADWYAADELPNVPGQVSISGRIIAWFRRTYG